MFSHVTSEESQNSTLLFNPKEDFKILLTQQKPKRFIDYPDRPSHYEYAVLSSSVYKIDGNYNELPKGWKIQYIFSTSKSRLEVLGLPIQSDEKSKVYWVVVKTGEMLKPKQKIPLRSFKEDLLDNGYVGILYVHEERRQAVLAHRGTSLLNLGALITDLNIVQKNVSSQQVAALFAAQSSIQFAKEKFYRFSTTGHSLGGWLSEVSVYHCLEEDKPWYYQDINAVTFDAPGSGNIMAKMDSHLKDGRGIRRETLDITHYVSIPNLINTCNDQVGTVYRITPELPKRMGLAEYLLFTLDSHGLSNTIKAFDSITGMPKVRELVLDWPKLEIEPMLALLTKLSNMITVDPTKAITGVIDLLMDGEFRRLLAGSLKALFKKEAKFPTLVGGEYGEFHQYTGSSERYEPNLEKLTFEQNYFLEYAAHYKVIPDNVHELCLVHFEAGTRRFLYLYHELRNKLSARQLDEAFENLSNDERTLINSYQLDIPKNMVGDAEKESIALTTVIVNSSFERIDDFRCYVTHLLSLQPELLVNLEKLHATKGREIRRRLSLVQNEITAIQTQMQVPIEIKKLGEKTHQTLTEVHHQQRTHFEILKHYFERLQEQLSSSGESLEDNSQILALQEELLLQKQELIFRDFLYEVHLLLTKHQILPRRCFISYAWEDLSAPHGEKTNQALQGWLSDLANDLKKIGIEVYLDINNLQGELSEWMRKKIALSDYILLIGTPRYKSRVEQENSNAAFELACIHAKLDSEKERENSNVLIPLLYSGEPKTSFPASVLAHLYFDFRENKRYYHLLGGLSNPRGLICDIYPEFGKEGKYHLEYQSLFRNFEYQLKLMQTELQLPVKQKGSSSLRELPPQGSRVLLFRASNPTSEISRGYNPDDDEADYQKSLRLSQGKDSNLQEALEEERHSKKPGYNPDDNEIDYKVSSKRQQSLVPDLEDPQEQNQRGEYYYLGKNGFAQDYQQAVHWFTKAAHQENIDAQFNLGLCFYYGHGVTQDYKMAEEWYTKAATQGDFDAQNNLGNMYKKGKGIVAKNLSKAVSCFESAAKRGYAPAQFNLAICYQNGDGVKQNYVEALKWYKKASDQGHIKARYWLAMCYEKAYGLDKPDFKKAVSLYVEVEKTGDNDARQRLERLKEKASEGSQEGLQIREVLKEMGIISVASVNRRR